MRSIFIIPDIFWGIQNCNLTWCSCLSTEIRWYISEVSVSAISRMRLNQTGQASLMSNTDASPQAVLQPQALRIRVKMEIKDLHQVGRRNPCQKFESSSNGGRDGSCRTHPELREHLNQHTITESQRLEKLSKITQSNRSPTTNVSPLKHVP